MESFEIITDSAANLPEEIINKYHIHVLSLSYYVDGVEYKEYADGPKKDPAEFYAMLRSKKNVTTGEVSEMDARQMGQELLRNGQDILYIGFSSALSGSVTRVQMAFRHLENEFPNRRIYVADSLGASLGEGLLVLYAARERAKYKPIEQVYRYVMENRLYICHEFMVDDLFYLRRGGRIAASTAVLGSTLGVRPVMQINDKGLPVEIGKARGRKKTLDALVDHMVQYAEKPEQQTVFVSHADCGEDAGYLADQVRERTGAKEVFVCPLNPVTAAHCGPGTVSLFYYGEHRKKKIGSKALTHIFIVNPVAGLETFADELRQKLERIEGLDYFIFSTRYAGYEEIVVKQVQEMFRGEKIRFYCCGGSGTFRNMINAFERPEEMEIAFYPCGMTNDVIKCFGAQAALFKDIEELVHGEVVDVDYIRTNHGICLNSFSTGLDVDALEMVDRYRGILPIGNQFPYTLSVVAAIFSNKSRTVEIYVDGERMEMSATELIFGNGCVINGDIRFSENPDLRDGRGSYFAVRSGSIGQLLLSLQKIRKRKLESLADRVRTGNWRQVRIVSLDGRPIVGNQDGELTKSALEWDLEIVSRGLHFVVPRGVSV